MSTDVLVVEAAERSEPHEPAPRHPHLITRRQEFCHFDDPLFIPIKTPAKGTGRCHQMTVLSPTAAARTSPSAVPCAQTGWPLLNRRTPGTPCSLTAAVGIIHRDCSCAIARGRQHTRRSSAGIPPSRRRDCHFDGTPPVPLSGVSTGINGGGSSKMTGTLADGYLQVQGVAIK